MALNLSEWLKKLETCRPEHKMLLGIKRVKAVLPTLLKGKSIARKVITIGGTNGKGSTVAFLEHIFSLTTLNYGATSSPHLLEFNERIRINGQPVSDELICESLERIERLRGDIFLSFFEVTTLIAFDIFSRANLDVVFLEVGLGGRLDAVNAIDPDIAIVTTVDLDHQQWLGETVEKIAAEKAGIFRLGKPAIYGDTPVPQALREKVADLRAQRLFKNQDFFVTKHENYWDFSGVDNKKNLVKFVGLPLSHLPFTSAVCAVQAALSVGLGILESHIREGLSSAYLQGRNQKIKFITQKNQKIIIRLDVAHNAQSAMHLSNHLLNNSCSKKRVALFAVLKDKDVQGIINALSNCFIKWYISTVSCEDRALSGEDVMPYLKKQQQNAAIYGSIPKAFYEAVEHLSSGDELVIFGSFYTVKEALLTLQKH